MSDGKGASEVSFLNAAADYYAALGVTVTRVRTDNGSCYKAFAFRDACKAIRLRHVRINPYTPKTNGKAGRCIQTVLREWAYAQKYQKSDRRHVTVLAPPTQLDRSPRRHQTTNSPTEDSDSVSSRATY